MTLEKVLVDILLAITPTVIAIVGALGAKALDALKKSKQLGLLRDLAYAAVQQAEELGYAFDVHGEEKMTHAIATLHDLGAKFGIEVSDDQARRIILAALTEFRAIQSSVDDLPDMNEEFVFPSVEDQLEGVQDDEVPAVETPATELAKEEEV